MANKKSGLSKDEKAEQNALLDLLAKEAKSHQSVLREVDGPAALGVPCDIECERSAADAMNEHRREQAIEKEEQRRARLDNRMGEYAGKARLIKGQEAYYVPEEGGPPRRLKDGQILVKTDRVITGSGTTIQIERGNGRVARIGPRTSIDFDGDPERELKRHAIAGSLG